MVHSNTLSKASWIGWSDVKLGGGKDDVKPVVVEYEYMLQWICIKAAKLRFNIVFYLSKIYQTWYKRYSNLFQWIGLSSTSHRGITVHLLWRVVLDICTLMLLSGGLIMIMVLINICNNEIRKKWQVSVIYLEVETWWHQTEKVW